MLGHDDQSNDFHKTDSNKPSVDQNVEALDRAKGKPRAVSTQAVPSSGRSENYQQLNVVIRRMIQSADIQSYRIKHLLRINSEIIVQPYREGHRRPQVGIFVNLLTSVASERLETGPVL
jgi:hypothetical protein